MKEIFTFHVQLAEIYPAVWRRLEIRAEGTFWDLHCAIQDAMPWEDKHLHEFRFPTGDQETVIGLDAGDSFVGDTPVLPSWATRLRDWFVTVPAQCLYEYDFGDEWAHALVLESRRAAEPGVRYPRCTAGERRCPPEDVGGPHGYHEFLQAISDRRHSEHRSYLEWIGGPWDPEDFRLERIVFSNPKSRLRMAGLG
jgi:pRiA4b ORF-3-like protein